MTKAVPIAGAALFIPNLFVIVYLVILYQLRQKARLFFLVTTALVIIASCKMRRKGHISNSQPTVIRLDSGHAHFSLAAVIDSLRIIVLETNVKSTISGPWGIQKILYVDNKYIILDDTYSAIKVFDTSGRYLYDIGKLGVRTGEFVKVEDIVYSPYHHSILVLSNQPNKVSEFSLDGHLIGTQRLDFFAHALALPGPNQRLFYVNQNKGKQSGHNNIILTDSMNEIQSRFFDMPKNFRGVIKFSGGLFTTNDGIYFNPAVSPMYYKLTADAAQPSYRINYDSNVIIENIRQDDLLKDLAKYRFQYPRFIKTKEYIGFNYLDNDINTAFINAVSGAVVISDRKQDSLNVLFASSMFQTGQEVAMILDIQRQKAFIKRHSLELLKRYPEFRKVLNVTNHNSNPALMIFEPQLAQ